MVKIFPGSGPGATGRKPQHNNLCPLQFLQCHGSDPKKGIVLGLYVPFFPFMVLVFFSFVGLSSFGFSCSRLCWFFRFSEFKVSSSWRARDWLRFLILFSVRVLEGSCLFGSLS